MKIIIRLPNWLGDLIMCSAFIENVQEVYPGSEISVIVKDSLAPLLHYFPSIKTKFLFSREDHKGLKGAYRFGKMIAAKEKYDIYFSMPDSFSSAVVGFATGAKKRIGYKNEFRSFLLTHSFWKNKNQHRVLQYLDLLKLFSHKQFDEPDISFNGSSNQKNHVIININSEATSRRMPAEKAISVIDHVRKNIGNEIILIGASKDRDFVTEVLDGLTDKTNIFNIAGETSLLQLSEKVSSAKLMLSTDSGPAHLANAFHIPLIVLFGAGNERITAPFNRNERTIIRLGKLSCEPCQNNDCKKYGIPKCLTLLSEQQITDQVLKYL